MMQFALYTLIWIAMQLVAWIITPLLPLFATNQYGKTDNANSFGYEPRLPKWLKWFDCPDNSLLGDDNFKASHKPNYLSKVIWLYRNSLYNFKWSVLAVRPDLDKYEYFGNCDIDYHTGVTGTFRIKCGRHWQYKSVTKVGSKYIILNFGWLLDDKSQDKALFMFSPRIK